jgi:putative nucleotidyltransferase with HDIG domain
MSNRVRIYVFAVCTAAALSAWLLSLSAPGGAADLLKAALSFALIGLVSQAYTYRLLDGASGSISFLPFLTAVVLAPNALSLALISASIAIAEAFIRRPFVKAAFNVAQYSLAIALGAIVYNALGGMPLRFDESFRLLPYCALMVVFFAVNTLAVSGVIAVSQNRNVFEVWRQNTTGAVAYDVLSVPVVYCFALIYNKFELAGVCFLAVLLLGARQLYRTNRQLETTNRELLEVIVSAIELRDPYTSGHSRRVEKYSKIIARAVGLSKRQVDRIGIAALLHDVGKIDEVFVPILQKPGRLTPEERAIIEMHSARGAELVAKVTELSDIVRPIRHHHEHWDGTGYPDKLSGEEIPLASRIIMFADTIDAMTTDRPYRKALGEAEVRLELIRCRGKQFDPFICDALLRSDDYNRLFDESNRFVTPISTQSVRRLAVAGG